ACPVPEAVVARAASVALGRDLVVGGLTWERLGHMSTHPIQRIEVALAGGGTVPMICKGEHAEPAGSGERERRSYERPVPRGRIGAPAIYGAYRDGAGGHWLLLEDVGDAMLKRAPTTGWRAAFTRLGEVHGTYHGRTDELAALDCLADHDAGSF